MGGQLDDAVDVYGRFGLIYQSLVPLAGHSSLHGGYKTHVALGLNQLVPTGQVSQNGQTGGRFDLGLTELQMARPANAVEDNARHPQVRIE